MLLSPVEASILDFVDAIDDGHAVSTRGERSGVIGVMPVVASHRNALVIELGARAAYDLIFGYDGPTVARYEVDGRGHLLDS